MNDPRFDHSHWWKRPRSRWLLGIPLGAILAFVLGAIAWTGFEATLAATNTTEFCTSCHEMSQAVGPEWEESVHFRNASGVRAGCPDCHVPRPFLHKIKRKIAATAEVWGKLTGKIDTMEKFEAHRLEMAERVWAQMEANDSRECRNCHSLDAMDIEKQDRSAKRKHTHEWREKKGETCITCHKGVAHTLPENYEG